MKRIKSFGLLVGAIALVLALALSLAACGDDSTGGGGGGGGGGGSYSLDGVWESSSGTQITVSGSTGILTVFNPTSGAWLDAKDKGYVKNDDQAWRNLTSTGNLTWSGQALNVQSNTSSPDVAIGTVWRDRTFTMSANGQTLTVDGTDIWTRRSAPLSLNGVWESSSGTQITVSGSTGILTVFNPTSGAWLDAKDKGYVKVGDQAWRNLTSTGNLTWSGQALNVQSNTSSPDVAIGTVWRDRTFTMSANGQTLTVDGTETWTRR